MAPTPPQRNLLRALQTGLESLYRLDPAPCVTGFLVTLDAARPQREELWLVEGDELELGLALDPGAITRLQHGPLADHNLAEFCLVVEGISHFLFVIHRARREHPTSGFELELQCEVDKYIAALLLARRCPSLHSERLRRRLYQGYLLLDGMSLEEQRRYHGANRLARRYTRRLEERFLHKSQLPAMLGELRRFYRLPCWAKQGLIARG